MLPHSFQSGGRYFARSFIGTPFVNRKYHSTDTHEHAWPHTVASAEPMTPSPITMTNR